MVIYLSNPYGTIPGENWREYRFYLLAKALAAQGHSVVWFTSTFSHHFKKQRTDTSKRIEIEPNLHIHLIKSPGYEQNLSWGRVRRDLVYGRNLKQVLQQEYAVPDLFIVGDSPVLFYFPSYWYARKFKVKFVVDQMDLWPELIVQSLPKLLRPIANLACVPIYAVRKLVYAQSAGFMSLAQRYLDIPMEISPGMRKRPKAVIYNGIDVDEFRAAALLANPRIDQLTGIKNEGDTWLIFAGTLGPSYDIRVMLEGFSQVAQPGLRLLIAGDGSEKSFVESFIKRNTNLDICYLGNISKSELPYLYSKCDIGLNAYGAYSNVEMSDKFYDYTAAGLGVLNSLKGEVADLVSRYNLGKSYEGGNVVSFVTSLKQMINDRAALEKMRASAYSLGTSFDQKKQLNQFNKFIYEVLNS